MKHESSPASAGPQIAGNGSPIHAGHDADSTASDTARDFHALLNDLEDLLSSASSLTGEGYALAKAKLSERIRAARASVGAAGSAVSDRARSSARTADLYVRNKPWQAVGVSAVAGLLIGLLLGRRGT